MDIQMKIINKVGIDKVLHFLAGGWLAAFAPHKMWLVAILIAVVVGLLKELVDVFIRKSSFDKWDWLATALGGLVTAVFVVFGIM